VTEIFVYRPNWKENLRVEYLLETAVSIAEDFSEQRRVLSSTPKRKFSVTVQERDLDAQKLVNFLKANIYKVVYLPIRNEELSATEAWKTKTVLSTVETTTYYWDLRNCDYLVLEEGDLREVKIISSVGANSVTVTVAVAGDFTSAAKAYPAILTTIENMSNNSPTSAIFRSNLEFLEYIE